ncbi:AP-4 complex subunit beta-1 [Holothuria leucospilota]|uniref:AP-4 complex subunit beta-1 n=1 Tax=Holothuria leucospilota TaxID=206669 RepID=A0A9Q1B9K2_HOLLE|nr:AP-4 complex subunit beta-1 [Holothuria leucospilota]
MLYGLGPKSDTMDVEKFLRCDGKEGLNHSALEFGIFLLEVVEVLFTVYFAHFVELCCASLIKNELLSQFLLFIDRARLTKAVDEGDIESLQMILSEVVGEMTVGADMSPLFPNMVKLCATMDLTCKKLVYLYISQYAIKQPDLALLAINSLQKDASDPNAMIRGLALKTLCNIRLPEFLEYIKKPLLSGLKDRSPYVRQIAATGSLKVYQLQPEFAKAHGIPAHDQMLYDTDSGVVVNAVRTLITLKEDMGQNFSLKQKTVIHLLNR